MKLIYSNNITDDSATMRLYRAVGPSGIDGAAFAEEMYWLSQRVPLIKLRVNSPGGSIADGFSIFAAMRESRVPVDTYNDFLAASMGGVIAQGGRKRYAAANSMIMLHNPSSPTKSVKETAILDKMKASLVDVFTGRGLEASIVSDLMDVESWIEARIIKGKSPMIEAGLADELFSTVVPINPVAQVFNASKLYAISNNILNKEEMELAELTQKVTGLTQKVETLEKENLATKEENETLKKSLKEKEDALKVVSDKAAVDLIENAIKVGKIKAEVKDQMITDAKASFDVVKNMLNAMPESTVQRFTNVTGSATTTSTASKTKAGREEWTIRDWEKKDPKGLQKIKNETPEIYQDMYNSHYKA